MTGVSHADTRPGTASHSGRVCMARDTESPGGGAACHQASTFLLEMQGL